jgi:hypothetical protein
MRKGIGLISKGIQNSLKVLYAEKFQVNKPLWPNGLPNKHSIIYRLKFNLF